MGTYAILADCRAVSTQNQLLRCGCERWKACNRQVFMIDIGVITQNLISLRKSARNVMADIYGSV